MPNKQMVDSILDNVSLRSQLRGEINLFIDLRTPPNSLEQLIKEIKVHVSSVSEIQHFNVLFNDIKTQGFSVLVEFFTLPLPGNQFNNIKQQLNFFILKAMDNLEIKMQIRD